MSLAKIQEAPEKSLILLVGAPGTGKSTFCYQVVAKSIAADRPVIFVTSERGPAEVIELLSERGVGRLVGLNFVDAFTETVGLTTTERPDTVHANCADLNTLSIAVTRLQKRMGQKGTLLVFDSLTSPYLFSGVEVVKFLTLYLSKFAAEGNSVLALMDEGCGKEEDLGAMTSVVDGILRMEIKESSRFMNVVKHPKVKPTRIKLPVEPEQVELKSARHLDPRVIRQFTRSLLTKGKAPMRKEVGDFVNLFWPSLAHWSGILWDSKRFPRMIYDLNKEDGLLMRELALKFNPWHWRLFLKLLGALQVLGVSPKNFSKVKDMKKAWKLLLPTSDMPQWEHSGILEYLDDVSKTDEHCVRVYESADCWGFKNVGAAMASHLPAEIAGWLKGFAKEGRDWDGIETKCIGLGDPYCEFKFVPAGTSELKSSLEKDISVIERIHERLLHRLMGFLLDRKPLIERPRLGSYVHLHPVFHAFGFPYLAGERYRMALRMGGAKVGKEVGERLMNAGLGEDEAVKRVIGFLEHCKVGKVTMDETVRIRENCEGLATMLMSRREEPCCFFTTGFLNGLFSAVKNQHVREIKCIAAGDPYCEWETK